MMSDKKMPRMIETLNMIVKTIQDTHSEISIFKLAMKTKLHWKTILGYVPLIENNYDIEYDILRKVFVVHEHEKTR